MHTETALLARCVISVLRTHAYGRARRREPPCVRRGTAYLFLSVMYERCNLISGFFSEPRVIKLFSRLRKIARRWRTVVARNISSATWIYIPYLRLSDTFETLDLLSISSFFSLWLLFVLVLQCTKRNFQLHEPRYYMHMPVHYA